MYISWRLELRMKEAIARAEYMQVLINVNGLPAPLAKLHATMQSMAEIETHLKSNAIEMEK